MADIKDRAREYLAEHSYYSEVFGQTFIAVDTLTAMIEFAEQETKGLRDELNYAKSHCLFHSDCPTQKENAELKSECRRCVYTDCPCVLSDYGKDRNGICNHFKDVFDENAELKEKLEGAEKARNYWQDSSFDWRHKCTSRKPFKVAVKVQKQLTEAKEIIKEFVDNVERYSINNEILDRAEQFLSVVER